MIIVSWSRYIRLSRFVYLWRKQIWTSCCEAYRPKSHKMPKFGMQLILEILLVKKLGPILFRKIHQMCKTGMLCWSNVVSNLWKLFVVLTWVCSMPRGCENFLSTRLLHQQTPPFPPFLLLFVTSRWYSFMFGYKPKSNLLWSWYTACMFLFLKDENGNAIIQLFEGVLCEFILKVSVLYYTVYHHIT